MFGFWWCFVVLFFCFFFAFHAWLIKVMPCDRAATRSRWIKRRFVFFSSGTLTAKTSLSERGARGRGDKNRRGRKKTLNKTESRWWGGFAADSPSPPSRAAPGCSGVLAFPVCRGNVSFHELIRPFSGCIALRYLIHHLAMVRLDWH